MFCVIYSKQQEQLHSVLHKSFDKTQRKRVSAMPNRTSFLMCSVNGRIGSVKPPPIANADTAINQLDDI